VPVQLREDDRQVEDGQKRRDEVRVKLEQRALAHLQQVIVLFSNQLSTMREGQCCFKYVSKNNGSVGRIYIITAHDRQLHTGKNSENIGKKLHSAQVRRGGIRAVLPAQAGPQGN